MTDETTTATDDDGTSYLSLIGEQPRRISGIGASSSITMEVTPALEEILPNARFNRTLAYPREFIGPKEGKGPANAAEAAKLWAWR